MSINRIVPPLPPILPAPPAPPAPFTCEAERITWNIGGKDYINRKWLSSIFDRIPNALSTEMAKIYLKKHDQHGLKAANLWLLHLNKSTNTCNIDLMNIALSECAISHIAKLKAIKCQRLARMFNAEQEIYENLVKEVISMGLKPPSLNSQRTYKTASKRILCQKWWRRQLRKYSARHFESFAINFGLVHHRRSIYVSNQIYKRYIEQHQRNIATLSKLEAINDDGNSVDLLELVSGSLANPKNRRSELMTRLEGIDHIAKEYGHEGLFLTITCPSKHHSMQFKSGDKNPKYKGYTPRESQQYLTEVWARIRAELARRKIKFYGFRIAEPHHDGAPHWHLLLFTDKAHSEKLINVCKGYSLEEDSNEDGADKYRFKVERIDRCKGSAVAYVAKYISKAIDGFGMDTDLYGKDAKTSAERVVVWAKLWGIRQFQQIGGPTVGVWRELRRLKIRPEGSMGKAFDAADSGDWAGYVQAMGGPFCTRNNQNVCLSKLSSIDHMTGEVRLNQYMEPASDQVYGLEADGESICTREHIWVIQNKSISHNSDKDESPLRYVNVTGNFGEIPYVNVSPLEFCQ